MAAREKQLDILAAYKAQQHENGQERRFKLIAVALIVAVLFGTVGTVYYLVQQQRAMISAQIERTETQLNSETLSEQLSEVDALEAELATQLDYNKILSAHLSFLTAVYRPDSRLMEDIEALAADYEVTCTVLTNSNGGVALACTSPSGSAAASFAKALEQSLLCNVTFYGYTYIESSTCYGFTVEGTDAGWEDAAD